VIRIKRLKSFLLKTRQLQKTLENTSPKLFYCQISSYLYNVIKLITLKQLKKEIMATKTKAPVVNLFATATVKKTAKAADDKEVVIVKDKEVSNALTEYENAKVMIAKYEAIKAETEGIIKPHANELWLAKIEATGKKPESFILSSNKHTDSLLYIVSDTYKTIDQERYEYLSETYGEDIVSDNSVYTMDNKMIQKYGAEISAAIMGAKGIPTEDKVQIIQKIEKYSVAKGTIERLKEIATAAKTSVATIFAEIIPTQSLKSRGSK